METSDPPMSVNSCPICSLPVASPPFGNITLRASATRSRTVPPAEVCDRLPDLPLPGGHPPLREHHLRVLGEQVEDAAPGRGDPAVVEGLEVLEGDGLALLVGHGLRADGHGGLLSSVCGGRGGGGPAGLSSDRESGG